MAPSKKKSAAKRPQNRGFATTSIPKKADPIQTSLEEVAAAEEKKDEVKEESGVAKDGVKEEEDEWDAEKQEELELQALAERIRAACDKEIAKQIKVLEYDKRLSKAFSYFRWDDRSFRDNILDLALSEGGHSEAVLSAEPEEKLLQRVVILYGILERLGFAAPRILECLEAIKALELDDAMDWLHLHCSNEELARLGRTEIADDPSLVDTDRVPSPANPQPLPSPSGPSEPTKASAPKLSSRECELTAELKQRIILSQDDSIAEDPTTTEYVNLKLLIADITKKIPTAGNLKGKALKDAAKYRKEAKAAEDKIRLLQASYNFDQRAANAALKAKMAELRPKAVEAVVTPIDEPSCVELLSAGTPTVSAPSTPVLGASASATPSHTTSSEPTSPSLKGVDALTDASDSDEAGMFGDLLEELPASELRPDTNTVVVVRDLPLPKHYSGKTPQAMLATAVGRIDKFAQTRYSIVSSSRAVRASVEIRWQGGKTDLYTMDDEACYDEKQAHNYIATRALFAISPAPTNRMLPPLFRDLWEEFEAKRKETSDRSYADHLKRLLPLAKIRTGKVEAQTSNTSRGPSEAVTTVSPSSSRPPPTFEEARSLQEQFLKRYSWPSFQAMQSQRAQLPIAAFREAIVSAVEENQVIVLCGETGCGKSTQLPSFLLEHEMCRGRRVKIFCTEPRRISAISLAQRVSQELGEHSSSLGQRGSLVGYNIRLEAKQSSSTRLTYATTGIVLRMLEGGSDLEEMTHLIIDEVHERSIDSDFLLIALKTILERRPALRVVLMSATVDAEKISQYMKGCPVLQVPGRTFPVSAFFLEDIIEMTGYSLDFKSDSPYVSRFNKRKPRKIRTEDEAPPQLDEDEDQAGDAAGLSPTYSKRTQSTLDAMDEHAINFDVMMMLLEHLCFNDLNLANKFSHAILVFMPSLDTIRRLVEMLESHPTFGSEGFRIFPLHSTISTEAQGHVFQSMPFGVRKIVIATNIAETGITIPDVTCVIDSGKHREMRYDEKRQISRLVETFIARSNAIQRRGRAGRVTEGICFHLFTKHRMDTRFAENPLPEMLRLSLQDLALRIKIMRMGSSIEDVLLQALDPPSVSNVQRAISSLIEAKALTQSEEITPLGRHLVKLPMDVHMGKLLILACLFRCLSPALTIAAALNSKSPFLTPFGREQEADAVKRSFKVENSDFLTLWKVYTLWRDTFQNNYIHQFCRRNFLSHQNLLQIEELRVQFLGFLVDTGFVTPTIPQPNTGRSRTRFASVPEVYDTNSADPKIVMACVAAAMYPKLLVKDSACQWRTLTNSAPASIHPSSVNFQHGKRPDFGDAKYIAYFNIMQSKKLYVWESGGVDEKVVLLLCGEADFRLPSDSLSIDRKIRVVTDAKTVLSLKIIRQRFQQLFNQKMKTPSKPLSEIQQRWFDLVTKALEGSWDTKEHKDEHIGEKGRHNTMTVKLAPPGTGG